MFLYIYLAFYALSEIVIFKYFYGEYSKQNNYNFSQWMSYTDNESFFLSMHVPLLREIFIFVFGLEFIMQYIHYISPFYIVDKIALNKLNKKIQKQILAKQEPDSKLIIQAEFITLRLKKYR